MSQDNTYKICLLIKPDDHESFDHDSFGTLIESLKLVFFFTEGLKFVNAANQI